MAGSSCRSAGPRSRCAWPTGCAATSRWRDLPDFATTRIFLMTDLLKRSLIVARGRQLCVGSVVQAFGIARVRSRKRCWCGETGKRSGLSSHWAHALVGSTPTTSTHRAIDSALRRAVHFSYVRDLRGFRSCRTEGRVFDPAFCVVRGQGRDSAICRYIATSASLSCDSTAESRVYSR